RKAFGSLSTRRSSTGFRSPSASTTRRLPVCAHRSWRDSFEGAAGLRRLRLVDEDVHLPPAEVVPPLVVVLAQEELPTLDDVERRIGAALEGLVSHREDQRVRAESRKGKRWRCRPRLAARAVVHPGRESDLRRRRRGDVNSRGRTKRRERATTRSGNVEAQLLRRVHADPPLFFGSGLVSEDVMQAAPAAQTALLSHLPDGLRPRPAAGESKVTDDP